MKNLFKMVSVLLSFTFGCASFALPSDFNYNDFLNWIKAHNYADVPDTFAFNPGTVTTEYPSNELAVQMICNLPGGCNSFSFWPFDTGEVGISYYSQPSNFAGGAKVTSIGPSSLSPVSGVITKLYIPMLKQTFVPNTDWTKPGIIGKNGLASWAPFDRVEYGGTLAVVYFDIVSLRSQNTRLMFEDVPQCLSTNCPTNPNGQYISKPAPLTSNPTLINGTTWRLISRQGVGPAFDSQPTSLSYSYSVTNGVDQSTTISLALTLGLNLSLPYLGSVVSTALTASWGSTIQMSESSTSSISAECTNVSPSFSKVCPTYELMATTSLYAPGLNDLFTILNGSGSKTPDVSWYLGESHQTDDGKSIGILYPIGGVFVNGISITQRADYLVPLTTSALTPCTKQIANESNQPWVVSGSQKEVLLGDPKYEFTGCAPMSPNGLCMIFPKSSVTYSGNFLIHQGYLKIGDANGQEVSYVEAGQDFGIFSSCPFVRTPDKPSQSISINDPTEGDVRITADYL